MSRLAKITLALLLLGMVIGVVYWLKTRTIPASEEATPRPSDLSSSTPSAPPLPGEPILQNYGATSARPEADLSMMAHALSNLSLLIKGQPLRLSANEEFAAALRGRNPAQLRFLPDSHPAFNAAGQIVDRWRTPLFFHALGQGRIDIRSAGPDREMWSGDDIHRRHDGQFLTGSALNASSLYDSPGPAGAR